MPHTLKPTPADGWELHAADGRHLAHKRFSLNDEANAYLAQDWADEILGSPQNWRNNPDSNYEAA